MGVRTVKAVALLPVVQVDGFRFDIMGHHFVSNMSNIRNALNALTVERDGVDGRHIYIYGEAWDFGEVALNQRGRNASQHNLVSRSSGWRGRVCSHRGIMKYTCTQSELDKLLDNLHHKCVEVHQIELHHAHMCVCVVCMSAGHRATMVA